MVSFYKKLKFILVVLGCQKCAIDKNTGGPPRLTKHEFLDRSKSIHNNYYDYSKVDFNDKTAKQKVIITCPVHGDFEQEIYSHTKGMGCKECGLIKRSLNRSSIKKETWKDDFKQVHGDLYDYSKVNYINRNIKVKIICSIHGEFLQSPQLHLKRCWL